MSRWRRAELATLSSSEEGPLVGAEPLLGAPHQFPDPSLCQRCPLRTNISLTSSRNELPENKWAKILEMLQSRK